MSTLTHSHVVGNAGAALALQLSDHFRACADFQRGYEEDLAALPLGKNGLPKGAHKLANPGFETLTENACNRAESIARTVRRLAILQSRASAQDNAYATYRIMSDMRALLIELKALSPLATERYVPSVLEPHGHGLTLKSQWVKDARNEGASIERIRENDREIKDNNNAGNDYSAMPAKRASVDHIVTTALQVAREDNDWR